MSRWGCGVGAHALRRVLTKIPSRPAMVEVGARSSGNKPAEEFLPASYGLPGTSSTRRRQTDVGPLLRAASLPETTESERTFLCLSPPRRPCALRPASSCAFRSTTWVGGWPVAGPNGNPHTIERRVFTFLWPRTVIGCVFHLLRGSCPLIASRPSPLRSIPRLLPKLHPLQAFALPTPVLLLPLLRPHQVKPWCITSC